MHIPWKLSTAKFPLSFHTHIWFQGSRSSLSTHVCLCPKMRTNSSIPCTQAAALRGRWSLSPHPFSHGWPGILPQWNEPQVKLCPFCALPSLQEAWLLPSLLFGSLCDLRETQPAPAVPACPAAVLACG